MATTTNYSWNLPTVGGNQDQWGDLLNSNWTALDTLLGGTSATEFAILDGATVTTAELNILDGVTATAAEINVLDGITATTTELNYTDGVTSNIQTQLDALSSGKQASDATLTAYAGTLTAANKIPYATAADTAGELDFKDEDDMASNSATAVPSQQSVKAYVDANTSPVKAWVNFYGISGITVNASSNVASVVRNGVGDYTVNFSSTLADQYFSAVVTPGQGTASAVAARIVSQTSSSVRFQTFQTGSGGAQDCGILNVMIAR